MLNQLHPGATAKQQQQQAEVEVAEVRTRAFRIRHRFWRDEVLLMEAEDVRAWCEITFTDDDARLTARALPEAIRGLLAG